MYLLGDLFYVLTHHPDTGRPAADAKALGTATAAGLIAELMISGHVALEGTHLNTMYSALPADTLGHRLYERFAREPEGTAADWLERLSADAVHDVAGRLLNMGLLYPTTIRAFLRAPQAVLAPADPNLWEGAFAHLRVHLLALTNPDQAFTAAAALLHVSGTGGLITSGLPGPSRAHLGTVAPTLAPQLYAVVAAAAKACKD